MARLNDIRETTRSQTGPRLLDQILGEDDVCGKAPGKAYRHALWRRAGDLHPQTDPGGSSASLRARSPILAPGPAGRLESGARGRLLHAVNLSAGSPKALGPAANLLKRGHSRYPSAPPANTLPAALPFRRQLGRRRVAERKGPEGRTVSYLMIQQNFGARVRIELWVGFAD